MKLTLLRLAAVYWSLAATTLLLIILIAGHDGDITITTNEYREYWIELGAFAIVWLVLLALAVHDCRAYVHRREAT